MRNLSISRKRVALAPNLSQQTLLGIVRKDKVTLAIFKIFWLDHIQKTFREFHGSKYFHA